MNRLFKSLIIGFASAAVLAGLVVPSKFAVGAQGEAFAPDSAIENIFGEKFAPREAIENIFGERFAPPSAVENIFEQPEAPTPPPPPPPPAPGAIHVMKFKDFNGNGQEDSGEPRMSGVTFTVTLANIVIGNRVTDGSGFAEFSDLGAGTYVVHEQVPDKFEVTTGNPRNVTLSAGETETVKFGNKPKVVVTGVSSVIQIIKFKDFNGDCVLNTGEPFMGGVTFVLTIENRVLGNKVTDQNGHAEFMDLGLGTYTVREEVPSGFTATCTNPATITLGEGETRNLFFGNKPVTVPVTPAPQPTPPPAPPVTQLPPSGVEDVLFPGASATLVTLYSMFRRQRKELFKLAKHLV